MTEENTRYATPIDFDPEWRNYSGQMASRSEWRNTSVEHRNPTNKCEKNPKYFQRSFSAIRTYLITLLFYIFRFIQYFDSIKLKKKSFCTYKIQSSAARLTPIRYKLQWGTYVCSFAAISVASIFLGFWNCFLWLPIDETIDWNTKIENGNKW